jgi:hypothetical protein
VLAGLVELVDPVALAARQRRRPRPRAEGEIAALARLGRVGDTSVLRRTGPWELAAAADGRVTLRTARRELSLPRHAAPALELIARGEPFAVADLSPWLDAPGRATLAARLVREGLVEAG